MVVGRFCPPRRPLISDNLVRHMSTCFVHIFVTASQQTQPVPIALTDRAQIQLEELADIKDWKLWKL